MNKILGVFLVFPTKKKTQNEPGCEPDQDSKEVALESKSGPQADYKPVKAASPPADGADAPAAENAPVESISEDVTAKLEEFATGGSYGEGGWMGIATPHLFWRRSDHGSMWLDV